MLAVLALLSSVACCSSQERQVGEGGLIKGGESRTHMTCIATAGGVYTTHGSGRQSEAIRRCTHVHCAGSYH